MISRGETLLNQHLAEIEGTTWRREVTFAPGRRWRFDFAEPALKIAIEVEGGLYGGGRHTRAAGYQNDLDKYNAATLHGWHLLRFSTADVARGIALATTRRLVARLKGPHVN